MFSRPSIVRILITFLIVVAAVSPAVYFYQKYQALKQQTMNASENDNEAEELVAKAAKHILLPTGETPTVMTVTDKEKLSGQAFFVNSKNGDKVLVYTAAKKAFLYDPVADIILEVGPVQENQATGNAQSTPSPAAVPVRFVLLNGTTTVGLTKKYETELKSKIPEAQVLDRDNAKESYEKSILVNLSGKSQASDYATLLGVTLAPLPEGETTPEADFLIILGSDKK